jgi:hypothetical protein
VAEVLTGAGWSVVVLEKNRNHLIDLTTPHEPLHHFANDEMALTHHHLLGPDPRLEPRTYRRSEADGDRLLNGRRNSLPPPWAARPRRRQALLVPEEDPTCAPPAGRSGRASRTGRGTRHQCTTPPWSGRSAWPARTAPTRHRVAQRPVPMPPGVDMPIALVSARQSVPAPPTRRRPASATCPTAAARLRRLRLLRWLRLPRARQGRPRGVAPAGAALGSVRPPARRLRDRDRPRRGSATGQRGPLPRPHRLPRPTRARGARRAGRGAGGGRDARLLHARPGQPRQGT